MKPKLTNVIEALAGAVDDLRDIERGAEDDPYPHWYRCDKGLLRFVGQGGGAWMIGHGGVPYSEPHPSMWPEGFSGFTRITAAEAAEMLKPDPYRELKDAYKDGKVIQIRRIGGWGDLLTCPKWRLSADNYRIKPEPDTATCPNCGAGVAVRLDVD